MALKQIQDLKTFIAQGDIAGMSKNIESIHKNWESLDGKSKDEVENLEAIFLSIVNLKIERV